VTSCWISKRSLSRLHGVTATSCGGLIDGLRSSGRLGMLCESVSERGRQGSWWIEGSRPRLR
jgi:hypothetical protein